MFIMFNDSTRTGGSDNLTVTLFSNGAVVLNMTDETDAEMQLILNQEYEIDALIKLLQAAKHLMNDSSEELRKQYLGW